MNTFQIVRLIGEAPKELLNFTETSLLTRMAFLGNKEGKDIRPGIKELIKQTKLSRMPLIKALGSLVKKDILIVCCNRSLGSWDKSCYDINVPLLQKIISMNYEISKNKNYKDNSKKPILGSEISPQSGIAEIPLSGIAEIPVKKDISDQVVSERYQGGIGEIPLSGIAEIPTPYIQLLEPITTHSNVKFAPKASSLEPEEMLSKISRKKNWMVEANEVFDHWRKVMNRERSKLDKKRLKKLISAFEHGFTVDELKKAVDGAKKSPFHRGDNDGGVIYDSIDLIFRNPDKIETFICLFDAKAAPKNKNVATGSKTTFVEKNKEQVEILNEVTAKLFPRLSKFFPCNQNQERQLTLKKEIEVNERE